MIKMGHQGIGFPNETFRAVESRGQESFKRSDPKLALALELPRKSSVTTPFRRSQNEGNAFFKKTCLTI